MTGHCSELVDVLPLENSNIHTLDLSYCNEIVDISDLYKIETIYLEGLDIKKYI